MSKKSAEILSTFLKDFSVSQSELATLSGISRFSIYKYLRGHPIHPKKARALEDTIKNHWRVFIPFEKLID